MAQLWTQIKTALTSLRLFVERLRNKLIFRFINVYIAIDSKWSNFVTTALSFKPIYGFIRVVKKHTCVLLITLLFAKFALFLGTTYVNTFSIKLVDLLTGQTQRKTPCTTDPLYDFKQPSIPNNSLLEDIKLDKRHYINQLLLLKKMYVLAGYYNKVNHYIAITNLRRLLRKDLDQWDLLSTVSEDAKLRSLKFSAVLSYPIYESPYIFDRDYANRYQRANREYDIDSLLHKFGADNWLLELSNTSENEYIRKSIVLDKLLSTSTNVKTFLEISKLYKWLNRNTFMQSKNLIKVNALTNTKKLFIPTSELSHLSRSNLWAINTLLSSVNSREVSVNFKNNILGSSNTYLLFNSKHFEKDYISTTALASQLNNTNNLHFYNKNFYWFLNRLYSTNSNNLLTPTILSSPLKLNDTKMLHLLNSLPLLHLLGRNISTLKNALILEQVEEAVRSDTFVSSNSNYLLDSFSLEFLYELGNPVTDSYNTFYHYSLNNYSGDLILDDINIESRDFLDVSVVDTSTTKTIFKSQPEISFYKMDTERRKSSHDLYNLLLFLKT